MLKGRESIDLQGLDNDQVQVFGHIRLCAVDGANVADGNDVAVVLELADRNVQGLAADEVQVGVQASRRDAGELRARVLGLVVEGGVDLEVLEEETDFFVRARGADDEGATALGLDR